MPEWSKYQRDIFSFVEEHPERSLLVKARAGSGKSTVIKEIARRISTKRKILVCAFNASTREALTKAIKQPNTNIQTFNQVGFRAVLRVWGNLTVEADRQQQILAAIMPGGKLAPEGSIGDMRKLITLAMSRLAKTDQDFIDIMDNYECAPRDPKDVERYIGWARETLRRSQEKTGVISFADQVYLPIAMGLGLPQYDDVLVDEAQDCNPLQLALIRGSVKPEGRLIAVGDPQQAIYSFLGSDLDTLDQLVAATDMHTLPLSVCYRCPEKVVELAKNIVDDLQAAPGAIEGEVVQASYNQLLQEARSGDLIISRSNAALVETLLGLLKEKKAAYIMGRDESASLEAFLRKVGGNTFKEFYERMSEYVARESERLAMAGKDGQVGALLDKQEMLIALGEGLSTIDQLQTRIRTIFGDIKNPPPGAIVLASVHKSKGLEYRRVWMLESTFRLRGPEDENLYYVAVTRAKETLFLVQLPGKNGVVPDSITDQWR